MVLKAVEYPYCKSTNVVKYGKDENGKQKYECRNKSCSHRTFLEEYTSSIEKSNATTTP